MLDLANNDACTRKTIPARPPADRVPQRQQLPDGAAQGRGDALQRLSGALRRQEFCHASISMGHRHHAARRARD
ncbi:hypothetical protein, partial [Methylobacterium sp. WL93]|uniref:hypothetical protein n=1 Tax=Methylobacterium sp. WL93 TaxID=2603892 RepID=UPI001AEE2854